MKAVLGLEDGTTLKGKGIGAEGATQGELVFATPFTGYEEALTDPSYKGQILMFTYPLIGNYGISHEVMQSDDIKAEGLAVRSACSNPSHKKSEESLEEFLLEHDVSGIEGIDTRMLTIKIRKHGTMKSALLVGEENEEKAVELAKTQPDITERDLIPKVSCEKGYRIGGKGPRIVVIDTGVKRNILKSLEERGADLLVLPHDSTPSEIRKHDPDALFVGNGPGDPSRADGPIRAVKNFFGEIPIFGICLGHQIISRALGGDTYKLKFGHRGANQPVRDIESGKIYITSQNHGFATDPDSLDGTDLKIMQINANDNTIEAIKHESQRVFAVQYHPEAFPGPRDSMAMFFDQVVEKAGGNFA
ncbi:carbamoyl phosphate synthase small subunit [candidate division MSBL1 archaeon SCGC-AAA261F19]|uniref:Carbamoyl phosphate synthase small chain n=2 Tax=candidate division MSBL1 TaxID=215777 RepID=A0A133VAD5_9EURY|nr:carbamoyl phosphate synthase small subunit [candidate division MSBL1 archaeon SCGC-AAA261D19]KXB03409.1 carbamoyl phosphate synthase small subunit [candidate division MSBL1 archaeon SCGC-AAA261F19]